MLHIYCDCSVFAVLTDERYFVAAAPVVPQFPVTGVVPHLHTVLGSPGIVWLRTRPVSEAPGSAVSPGPVRTARAGGVPAQPDLGAPGETQHQGVLSLVAHRHQVGLQGLGVAGGGGEGIVTSLSLQEASASAQVSLSST